MGVDKQVYPLYFPKGCPPDDASTGSLTLFRFCVGEEPTSDDFKSYYELNKSGKNDSPLRYGLSVMKSKEACITAYRKYPPMRKYSSVAVGETNFERGCWKNTPNKNNPDHATWWVCDGVEPVAFFTQIVCFTKK